MNLTIHEKKNKYPKIHAFLVKSAILTRFRTVIVTIFHPFNLTRNFHGTLLFVLVLILVLFDTFHLAKKISKFLHQYEKSLRSRIYVSVPKLPIGVNLKCTSISCLETFEQNKSIVFPPSAGDQLSLILRMERSL